MSRKSNNSAMNFQITFQLNLYLASFNSISMGSQGHYYIAVSLCPKNAILASDGCPCENPLGKVHSTHTFHIKYTSQNENIGQCFPFTFTLQQNLLQPIESKEKEKTAFNHILVISFELMKKVHEDVDYVDEEPKFSEDYLRVGYCSLEMSAKNQQSFSEFIDVNFDLPFSSNLNGAIFCLLKSIQPVNEKDFELLLAEKQTTKDKKIAQQLKNFKNMSKKYIFSSFIVRKQMQEAFQLEKISLNKPLQQSQRTWNDAPMNNLSGEMTSSEIEEKETSIINQIIENQPKQQEGEKTVLTDEAEKYLIGKVNEYIFNKVTFASVLEDLITVSGMNEKFYEQLIEKFLKKTESNIGLKIDFLEKNYQTNRLIIYNQKIRSEEYYEKMNDLHRETQDNYSKDSTQQQQENSFDYQAHSMEESSIVVDNDTDNQVESAYILMKKYNKTISKLKSKQNNKYFTASQKLFNLIPTKVERRFDLCPYIFHSATHCIPKRKAQNLFQSSPLLGNKEKGVKNLFILAHGYQANSDNMEHLKIGLKRLFPTSKYLLLSSYQGHTDKDIRKLGAVAAKEIQEYVQSLKKRSSKKYRMIMVGHSMGGIILRTAIIHLSKQMKSMFHTYISFATPHLGYLHCQNMLTETGLKIIGSLNSSVSLQQIANRDHGTLKETFIYELSQKSPLTNFKHLILFSSLDDGYVPWNSARIQIFKEARKSGFSMRSQRNHHRLIEGEMIGNILGGDLFQGNKIQSIHRFQVDFNINEYGIDTLIGRTAHVAFLINEHILPMAMLGCLKNTIYEELNSQQIK